MMILQFDLMILQSPSFLPRGLTSQLSLFALARMHTLAALLLALSGQHVPLSHAATQDLISKTA